MTSRRQSDRAFGFMFAIVFALLTGIVWFVSGVVNVELIIASAMFTVIALLWPIFLLPLNRLWQKLIRSLGFITNHLVLGVFLYVVITPIGLVMRISGRNPMVSKFQPKANTYFTAVKRDATAATFPDMF
jgi:nitrate reductase gamma subunit